VRVLSGTVEAGGHLQNPRARSDERTPHLFLAHGREQIETPNLVAGEIGVIPKLQSTHTGDVLLGPGASAVEFPPIPFPSSLYRSAVHPHRQDDVDKLSTALARLTEQDPTIRLERDEDSGELVLCTLGDVQASVAAARLAKTYGVEVDVTEPLVPYRETIRTEVSAEHRHKKQTGGRGQFGHVVLHVEPLPRGSGFEFAEKVVGGAVPRSFIPAVETGVTEALAHGPIAGARLVDLRVTLTDGSSHSVDSSELAFKLAGSQALHEAVQKAQPALLEPVMRLHISIPADRVGDITGEIAGKRGTIRGVDTHDDISEIDAQAPLAEIQRFTTELRALTGGRGRFEIEFDHYAEVPPQVQERLVEQAHAAG
jgi:elongation factor G